MRIAHVSDCYLPRTGGIETQVRALALQQRDTGHEVAVITATRDGAPSVRTDEVDRIPVTRVAMRLPAAIPVHPRTAYHVRRALQERPVDVVHVHAGVISPFAWSAARAACRMGIPVLVTVHSVWGGLARRVFAVSDLVLRWSRWPMQLSSVSGVAAERIQRALVGTGDVLVVPNGIDPALWAPLPGEPSEPGTIRVAAVMRLAPRKRLGALLDIVEESGRMLAPSTRVRLVVAGDGPERSRALRAVARRGLPVELPGRLGRDRLRELFAASDVFVQPSVRESFGLAALEARSAGLPVIIRSQTGSTEFVRDGVEGLVADDDAAMARALARLATDQGLRTAIAEHNGSTEPSQTWPGVLAAVEEAYAAAVRRAAP